MPHATSSLGSVLLWVAGLLASSLACAQPATVVGILEGSATLIRQTTRYALAEGMALHEQDIVETAPGAFAQLELPGGVLVGLGESTRLMLRPRLAKGKGATPLYLLQGWVKASSTGGFGYASPAFEIATQAGTSVVRLAGSQYEVFLESGGGKLTARGQAIAELARRAAGAPERGGQAARRARLRRRRALAAHRARGAPAAAAAVACARLRPGIPRRRQGRPGAAPGVGAICRPGGPCAQAGHRGRAPACA